MIGFDPFVTVKLGELTQTFEKNGSSRINVMWSSADRLGWFKSPI